MQSILWFGHVFGLVASGLLGALISLYINHRGKRLDAKRDCLRKPFGNRRMPFASGFYEALNEIPILFNDDAEVLSKWKKFYEVTTAKSDKKLDVGAFTELVEAMARSAKIRVDRLDAGTVNNVFS